MTFLLASGLASRPAQATEVSEVILDNGLKVLLLEDHKSPAVTFQVWYRVGSRNEKDGKSGLAHFLEFMLGFLVAAMVTFGIGYVLQSNAGGRPR